MTESLVDSATIAQVVQCLESGMRGQYPWSLATVLEFTALLMREEHLALAPGLAPPMRRVGDEQDLLVDLMVSNGVVSFAREVSNDVRTVAISKSKQWVGREANLAAVAGEVDRFLNDATNFTNWIEWAANRAWIAHSQRLGGLIDDTYCSYVAKVIGKPLPEVRELQCRSRNLDELRHLVNGRTPDFDLLVRAYVASAIIRGRYHEEVARQYGFQMIRHPLRGIVSKTRTCEPIARIHVPTSAWCLACIVLYGAAKQKRLPDRLRCWVSNVQCVRSALARGGLRPVDGTFSGAVDAAYTLARQAGVQIVDSRFDTLFEIVTSLGMGTLTYLSLRPWWLGMATRVAAQYALRRVGYPGKIRNTIAFITRKRLLKKLAAGRIETEWSRPAPQKLIHRL